MYESVLAIHSLVRWVVIGFGALALGRAISGWIGRTEWTAADDQAGRMFTLSVDMQALIGFILYFLLSPVTTSAVRDLGAAMTNGIQRYWAVEHLTMMVAALALSHIGRGRSRKAVDPAAKHRSAALFFGATVLLLLAGIPWPFARYGRPLVPLG